MALQNVRDAIEWNNWDEVKDCLDRGQLSEQDKAWVIEQACVLMKGGDVLTQIITHHCSDNQLDSVLTTLVNRRKWGAVGAALKRGISDCMKQEWAVTGACMHADNFVIARNILPHCADNQLNTVLRILVERGLWKAVSEVLKRGVSKSASEWAVAEACKLAGYRDIVHDVLPHCSRHQLDTVITTLVERRLWVAVGKVLERGVTESKQWFAAQQAWEYAHDDTIATSILPYCPDDQLDSVLKILMERGLWEGLDKMLQRGLSDVTQHWIVREACKHASNDDIVKYISPHCVGDQIHHVLDTLMKRSSWLHVDTILDRDIPNSKTRWVVGEACKHAAADDIVDYILHHCADDQLDYVMTSLVERGLLNAAVQLLRRFVDQTLCGWAVTVDETESDDSLFWNLIRSCCDVIKHLPISIWKSKTSGINVIPLFSVFPKNYDRFFKVVLNATLEVLRDIWFHGRETQPEADICSADEEAKLFLAELHKEIKTTSHEVITNSGSNLLPRIHKLCSLLHKRSATSSPFFILHLTKYLINHCYKQRDNETYMHTVLMILTCVPVHPAWQTVALNEMLGTHTWDVISCADLTRVHEQDRRRLFQVAVKERQWNVVKRWADHTLYDDQRLFAMEEAFIEKQWDVYLFLSQHGLTEGERMIVYCRVARHADLGLVRHMFNMVADATHMLELLTNVKIKKMSQSEFKKHVQRIVFVRKLETKLTEDTQSLKTLNAAVERGEWCVVMYNIRHKLNPKLAGLALKAAVAKEAWHVVIQLVRLEVDVSGQDSLFRKMLKRQQWDVCRVLLEQGISVPLCLKALSRLKQQHQWALVAIVMGYDVGDDVRKEVMDEAMTLREGSVVWQCIANLQSRLTVADRNTLFQRAFNLEIWQAVKPLVEEKDSTGIQHRDTAFLEAIEQHQWDVVDHCQRHDAEINMQDEKGNTPNHRAARKGDWEAVNELTARGGDPSLWDSEGESVLHRAIAARQWDSVKLLITFQGDIHQEDIKGHTPLQMLIDARQADMIDHTLIWLPDQGKRVNAKGETTLHAVCSSDKVDTLYYLVARRADPLAATRTGYSALCCAVNNEVCPQEMVAECISLGFSTHQTDIINNALRKETNKSVGFYKTQRLLLSPLYSAVTLGLPVVAQMLHESGSCSNADLFMLSQESPDLVSRSFREPTHPFLHYFVQDGCIESYFGKRPITQSVAQAADYVRKVSSTPRSLLSLCRLVIARCLTLTKRRHKHILKLRLPTSLKNYVKFTELTDPAFAGYDTSNEGHAC